MLRARTVSPANSEFVATGTFLNEPRLALKGPLVSLWTCSTFAVLLLTVVDIVKTSSMHIKVGCLFGHSTKLHLQS